VTSILSHVEIRAAGPQDAALNPREPDGARMREMHPEPAMAEAGAGANGDAPFALPPQARPARRGAAAVDPADPATWGRVSRNAPCPCGSGRKYKHCHGKV
jgi:preprotein translocase subunit SecA